jgi:hypothetical protein
MGSRMRHRRVQLDRAGIAALTGASLPTVEHWYRRRTTTGFPAKADTDTEGRDWWWRTDIERFHAEHQAARAATFTHVERGGNPRDLLTAPQAAQVLGYKNHRSLPDALLNHPDRAQELPSGRLRRRWYRATVWAYADGRPLRHSTGRPIGTGTGPRMPHPYTHDPRLDIALALLAQADAAGTRGIGLGAELARRLGIGERTAQRLIQAARQAGSRPPEASGNTTGHQQRP